MSLQAHYPRAEEHPYRRLVARLTSRARLLGSRDAEGAAQEALRRAIEHPQSGRAVEYYFGEELPRGAAAPEWPLDQLVAWLHAVLRNVVREEHARASFRREVSNMIDLSRQDTVDPRDPEPDPLETLIETEMKSMVAACLPHLDSDYRAVVELRMEGLAYADIAARLRVNQNTAATWFSRGIRSLARCVRLRIAGKRRASHV